ncbi:MAG TPA: HEAT repeat domain-containing protein [Pyrinomonadaceae bacterium]|nr:HEAT repeat domain-containing protein [Pyrinomonadaceae bacterium]
MTSASEFISNFIMNYVVNATWQIAAIAAVTALASLLLKNAPTRYRHLLWLAALLLCVVVPLLSATPRTPANQSLQNTPANSLQIPLGRVTTEPDIPVTHLTKRRTQIINATPRMGLWLTLAYALFLAWRGIRLVRFWRQKERLKSSANLAELTPEAEGVARRCRAILGIKKVDVVQSSGARMPYTIGARKPLIVLPSAFCDASEEHLLSALGHEMAHVARRDYLTNLVCELALLPISFHPLAFVIKNQIDRARELACDELVSKRLLPAKLYARSLVWAADTSSQARSQALLLSMFDARSLEERVMRLTSNRKRLSRSMAQALTSIMLVTLCAAAVALSLFSFEIKTEARAVFTSPAATAPSVAEVINPNPSVARAETVPTQEPRTKRSLDAPNAQQRAEAACAAGQNGDTEQIPTLIAMLADDAKTELLRCWSNGRWSPALETFKQPSPGEQAAIALASMGREALQPLTNQLLSEDATVRRNAAWAIGELTNMPPGERDGAVPRLISLLTDSDPWVRMAAARALGEVRNHSAVPGLIANLADTDVRVRELTVWALSELKDGRAVAALCNVLLSDLRAEVRRGAAEALGEIRSAEALPSLKQALNDPAVNARAQWAISEIEGE